jgi:hypothetical protein
MDWVYLAHKETGGRMQAPDEPGVVEWYAARGWAKTDAPADAVFVPKVATANTDEWVTLEHPGIGATHEFPNNPEALAGAMEAGWSYIEADVPPEPEPAPAPKSSKAKADVPPATDDQPKE